MLIEEPMYVFVFKIANFAVLIGALTYLFRRYALPQLFHAIEQQQQEERERQEKLADLKEHVALLQKRAFDQEALRERLLRNIAQWQEHAKKIQQELERQATVRQELMAKHDEQRARVFAHTREQSRVMVQVFAAAHAELAQRCAGQAGKQFVGHVVDLFQKDGDGAR